MNCDAQLEYRGIVLGEYGGVQGKVSAGKNFYTGKICGEKVRGGISGECS